MYRFLQSWRLRRKSEFRNSETFGCAFVASVVAVIGLYILGFALLGHFFDLVWIPNKSKGDALFWSGWNGIEHLFAFGDSYTTTSFDIHGVQPTPGNPLGNKNAGWPWGTQVNSTNFVEYLMFKYNQSLILTYNFAWAGGTIDNRIDQSPFGSIDFHDQVTSQFSPHFGKEQMFRSWKGNDSLFLIFFGINDIALMKDELNASEHIRKLLQSYANSTEQLYEADARNFLFINVPAVDRSPSSLAESTTAQQRQAVCIQELNAGFKAFAMAFAEKHSDTAVFFLDANALTNKVLDNPQIYSISSVIRNTTDFCLPYERSPDTDLFDPSCGIPRNEYFWADQLHPTSTVHDLFADQIVKVTLREQI